MSTDVSRVALFGGSFNPPHVAHQLVALYVLETCAIDELWFVPTFVHPFHKELAPYDDRIEMCKLAVRALGARAKVSRAEETLANKPGFVSSRTLELVEMLREQHPERQFRIVIGGDILAETHKWYRWADLAAIAPPIVVGRTGFALPPGTTETGIVMPEISATRARELVAAGDPHAASLLPSEVLRYIAARGLYK
ncbi:nicotinate (nicotinamide) nucleotide adenylyltransferase [soil metagenome]